MSWVRDMNLSTFALLRVTESVFTGFDPKLRVPGQPHAKVGATPQLGKSSVENPVHLVDLSPHAIQGAGVDSPVDQEGLPIISIQRVC